MRIFIDARYILRKDGTGRVTYNLLQNILLEDHKNKYFILTPSDYIPQLIQENVLYLFSSYASRNGIMRVIWDIGMLTYLLQKYHIEIYYSFENFCAPIYFQGKVIITIHDIIPLTIKKYYKKLFNRIWFKFKVFNALQKAHRIIVVSEFTKNEVINYFPKSKTKLYRIYNALDSRFAAKAKEGMINPLGNLNTKKYFFCIGGLEQRKNNILAIKAFISLRQQGKIQDFELVIMGVGNEAYSRVVNTLALNIPHSLEKSIHWLTTVNDEELLSLYMNAYLFIFPSLYEGFGIPLLEAMAVNTPCITIHSSSLLESGGDACIIIENDQKALENAIISLVCNQELYQSYQEKGLKHITKFSWKNGAKELIEIFGSIGSIA